MSSVCKKKTKKLWCFVLKLFSLCGTILSYCLILSLYAANLINDFLVILSINYSRYLDVKPEEEAVQEKVYAYM